MEKASAFLAERSEALGKAASSFDGAAANAATARKETSAQAPEAGAKVRVKGLSKATQFNGRIGHVTGAAADGRFGVKINGTKKTLAVKMEHLEVWVNDATGFVGSSQEATAARSSERASLEVEPGPDALMPDVSNELGQKPSSLEEKEALDRAFEEDGFEASI